MNKNFEDQTQYVLLIDDELDVRQAMNKVLTEHGFEAIEASSGEQAIKILDDKPWTWKPSAIVTDLVLPGESGFDLIRRLNERYKGKKVPIVVVSKLKTVEDVNEAEVAGAVAYLIKPFKPSKLIEALKIASERYHKRQANSGLIKVVR